MPITYQIERAIAGTRSWEQTRPQFDSEQEAVQVLEARRIETRLLDLPVIHRLVRTTIEIIDQP